MKKSKIIVPALAVLVLSTASAVSGTVAWFSASRSAKITGSSTVINPEGTLNVKLKQLVATKVDNLAVSMATNAVLRDASVDVSSGSSYTAYRAILGSTTAPTGYEVVDHSETKDSKYTVESESSTYNVYYFAAFTAEFSVNGASSTNKYDVFFDAGNSTFTGTDTVQNGYRVGMIATNKTNACVWAPKATGDVTYVNGTSASNASATYTKATGSVSNAVTKDAAEADSKFLGTIVGTGSATVTFIVWYDGTDSSVITNNLGFLSTSEATYTMAFNAIEHNDFKQGA